MTGKASVVAEHRSSQPWGTGVAVGRGPVSPTLGVTTAAQIKEATALGSDG